MAESRPIRPAAGRRYTDLYAMPALPISGLHSGSSPLSCQRTARARDLGQQEGRRARFKSSLAGRPRAASNLAAASRPSLGPTEIPQYDQCVSRSEDTLTQMASAIVGSSTANPRLNNSGARGRAVGAAVRAERTPGREARPLTGASPVLNTQLHAPPPAPRRRAASIYRAKTTSYVCVSIRPPGTPRGLRPVARSLVFQYRAGPRLRTAPRWRDTSDTRGVSKAKV